MNEASRPEPAAISVVIPAFNAERFLAATVRSVLAQQGVPVEIVVVDDGSTDGTPHLAQELAREDNRVRVVRQANRGLAAARNAGFCAARAHYPLVLFLDADDLLEPDALLALSSSLHRSPASPAAHGLARYIDPEGKPIDARPPERLRLAKDGVRACEPEAATTLQTLALQNCIMSAGAILIRKTAMSEVGPFDGSISPTADHDMWFRLARLGEIAWVPRLVLAYRVHPGGMSKKGNAMRSASLRMRRQWLAESDPEQRRLIRGAYRAANLLAARSQVDLLRHFTRRREWRALMLNMPLLCLALAKTLPGTATLVLGRGQPRLGERQWIATARSEAA